MRTESHEVNMVNAQVVVSDPFIPDVMLGQAVMYVEAMLMVLLLQQIPC